MGLVLIPSEVIQKVTSISETVQGIAEGYQNVLLEVQNFADESELDTKAWNTMKEKVFEYHLNIAQGMTAVVDRLISDATLLQESVGTEELYEDTLTDSIEKLESEIEECENEIEELEKWCNGFWSVLLGDACAWIKEAIAVLKRELDTLNQVLKVYKEKLEFLRDVEDSTKNLFETSEELLSIVENAIHDAGVEITGIGEKTDGTWKLKLAMAVHDSGSLIREKEPLIGKYGDSSREFIKKNEGIWETVIETDGVYSIGYGCDFTEKEEPELYQKYVIGGESITQDDADMLLDKKVKIYVQELDKFIKENDLRLNQNQYDALVSYFYNNGQYVFTDDAYVGWINKGGEYAIRAEARKNLKEYLINENGNYEEEAISRLFLESKGPSIKYEYEDRRKNEAELFNKPCDD